jgi:AmmeMemoRadiSam system protein A
MKPDNETAQQLLGIAKSAIATHLDGGEIALPKLPHPWHEARAVFVTLRRPDGSLRGCIGHLSPSRSSLIEEITHDAVLAATKDPRFPPVSPSELESLSLSISILGPAEPIADSSHLDPKRFGVIVTQGQRRGVLLPNIDGVDTVEQQLRITRRKANIEDHTPVQLSRFEVIHVPPGNFG